MGIEKEIVQQLKPGKAFKEIYVSARAIVQQKCPDLVDRFVKNVGFVMGLEFKDPQLILSEKSERQVVKGMAISVSVGFCDTSCEKPWAIWLSDTVVVGDEPQMVTTASKKPDDMMYELEDGGNAEDAMPP